MTSLFSYDFFCSLSQKQPIETPIEKLMEMYEMNIKIDFFMMDILVAYGKG
jgi:hypothetical protein